MAKKTLEEKIKNVGFWTFGFVFWYLVIAFFLKSSYPIYEYPFNREDAYEAIKDALTLVAAFLAPVAALVLFSDWKNEHVEKKLDALFDKLSIDISDIELILWQSHYKPAISIKKYEINLVEHSSKGSLFNMIKNLQNDINIIKGLNTKTLSLESQLSDFADCTKEIEGKIKLLKVNDNNEEIEKIPANKRQQYITEVDDGLVKIGALKNLIFEELNELKIKSS